MKYIIILSILLLIINIYYIFDCISFTKNNNIISKNININKKKIFIKDIEEEDFITKNIIQTYKNKESVPSYVFENIKSKNKGWDYHFYDNNKCKDFLLTHFGQEFVDKFNEFKIGPHKSDLFRVCWLYINGGIYVDIDSYLHIGMDNMLEDIKNNFTMMITTVRKHNYQEFLAKKFGINSYRLVNSFIIANKGNKLLKKTITAIMNVTQEDLDKYGYTTILITMQQVLGEDFEYEIEEKYSITDIPKMYTKKGTYIGLPTYKGFENHKFVN